MREALQSESELPSGDPWRGANPSDPAFRDDPYPALNRLRDLEPVHVSPWGHYRITRYRDVAKLLKETRVGMRTTEGRLPFTDESVIPRTFMLQRDPPDHTRLRRLVSRAFSVPTVTRMRAEVDKLVEELIDAVEETGRMDVIKDLALPLPSAVICRMMGVPLEDRALFTTWTAHATHGLLGDHAAPDVQLRAYQAVIALRDYFDRLVAQRRARHAEDLIGTLLEAESDGDMLTPEELMSHLIGLLIAGFETTIGLIGNGVRQLILHPDALEKLEQRPELIERAVEECLRYDGPILATRRVLHEDAEFSGVTIPKNATVDALLAAAHRDPEVFLDPERFDVERDPNPHFAFGGGPHYCLGAHLARLEARAAIGALVRRTRGLRLLVERVEWGPSIFRVPATLPVSFAVAALRAD